MKKTLVTVLVLCAGLWALGGGPIRLEGSIRVFELNDVAIKGMVDLNQKVAVRLCLLELQWGNGFGGGGGGGAPEALSVTGLHQAEVVYSPWRGSWKVEPYCFGGLGFSYARTSKNDTVTMTTALSIPFGLGIEQLLFFWDKVPSVFFEFGTVTSGRQILVEFEGSHSVGQRLLPELMMEARLGLGVRI